MARLTHPHAPYPLPAANEWEYPALLALVPVECQVVYHQLRMGEVCQTETGVREGEFLIDYCHCSGVHPDAPVFFSYCDAEQTKVAQFTEKVGIELLMPVMLMGLGLDFLLNEVPHHVPQHPVLLGWVG